MDTGHLLKLVARIVNRCHSLSCEPATAVPTCKVPTELVRELRDFLFENKDVFHREGCTPETIDEVFQAIKRGL